MFYFKLIKKINNMFDVLTLLKTYTPFYNFIGARLISGFTPKTDTFHHFLHQFF